MARGENLGTLTRQASQRPAQPGIPGTESAVPSVAAQDSKNTVFWQQSFMGNYGKWREKRPQATKTRPTRAACRRDRNCVRAHSTVKPPGKAAPPRIEGASVACGMATRISDKRHHKKPNHDETVVSARPPKTSRGFHPSPYEF